MREIVIEPRFQRAGDVFVEALGPDDPRMLRLIRVRRNEPNPAPLPLAQGSVIYAEIGEQWAEWFFTQHGTWAMIQGFRETLTSAELHDRLTRFHVISEPRLLVVLEIAQWFEQEAGPDEDDSRRRTAETIRREFIPDGAIS